MGARPVTKFRRQTGLGEADNQTQVIDNVKNKFGKKKTCGSSIVHDQERYDREITLPL